MQDIRRMQVGQVVDFVITYNERQNRADKADERRSSGRRKATQADIDAFFG